MEARGLFCFWMSTILLCKPAGITSTKREKRCLGLKVDCVNDCNEEVKSSVVL